HPRFNTVRRLPKGRLEQLLAGLVISLVLTGAAVLIPTAAQRLMALPPSATPLPTPTPTAPPASVLLPDELDRALEGVVTVVNTTTDTQLRLEADDLPGNVGGPVVGPGGKVLGVLTGNGTALPINLAQPDIAQWHGQPGTPAALAPFPSFLVLRTNGTASPPPSSAPTVQTVSPSRVSTGQATVVTLQGSGFTDGPMLRVRFVPLA